MAARSPVTAPAACTRRRRAAHRWLPIAVAVLPSCYASNVVASRDRAVAAAPMPSDWRPATSSDLLGYHASTAIRGDAALSLRRVYYWFAADGTYTGAALIEGDDGYAFQTLSGTWSLDLAGLHLDGAEPVPVDVAAGLVRIHSGSGEVVLAREASQ